MKKILINSFKFILSSILLLVLTFITLFGNCIAYAASTIDDETVITDLSQDPNFNQEDYPGNPNDYSLQVIQLAETKENELVVYVYQPSHSSIDLKGTKISISYGFSSNGANLHPNLYDLELTSTNGVFDKYTILDFPVPGDTHRYYNIISIFREFNSVVDEESGNEYYDISDKAYSVGQQWYIYDLNDSKGYEMATFKTLTLNTIFNSHFQFNDGLTWGNFVGAFNYGDCWYICFNCEDYIIKHIYDADMTYDETPVTETWIAFVGTSYTRGETTTNTITLTDEDTMSYTGNGLGARTFKWNRILSSSDFLQNVSNNQVNLDESARQSISSSQWVFTYTETSRTFLDGEGSYTRMYSDIDNVGILRLHFMDVTGRIYDLGVVNTLTNPNNQSSGTGYAKNIFELLGESFEKFFLIMGIVIIVLLLVALSNFITPIFKLIKFLFKALISFVSLPFKIFGKAFKK